MDLMAAALNQMRFAAQAEAAAARDTLAAATNV